MSKSVGLVLRSCVAEGRDNVSQGIVMMCNTLNTVSLGSFIPC